MACHFCQTEKKVAVLWLEWCADQISGCWICVLIEVFNDQQESREAVLWPFEFRNEFLCSFSLKTPLTLNFIRTSLATLCYPSSCAVEQAANSFDFQSVSLTIHVALDFFILHWTNWVNYLWNFYESLKTISRLFFENPFRTSDVFFIQRKTTYSCSVYFMPGDRFLGQKMGYLPS